MLPSFPKPYPDELLYSLFSRYHVRAGNTSASMTSKDLFGKRSIRAVWDLPSNLRTFAERVGGVWDAEVLLTEHTLYNYYAPFLKQQHALNVKESMLNNEGNTVHVQAGLTSTKVKAKLNMWICNVCSLNDFDLYGETYWRRVHQAPGVFICPRHGKFLTETCIPIHEIHARKYHLAGNDLKRNELDVSQFTERDIRVFYKIALLTERLLSGSFHLPKASSIQGIYFECLRAKGYATHRVKLKELYQDFNSYYTETCLKFMQSSLSNSKSDWLRRICQSHRISFHPIRHLLLLVFLDMDLDEVLLNAPKNLADEKSGSGAFLDSTSTQESFPFGVGPWPCLNAVCPYYKKLEIKNVDITLDYKSKKPVGTFACECGFIYTRSKPDINAKIMYRGEKVKDYGQVWRDNLTRLVKEEKSLTSIAKELHVCDATVKKYAFKLGLETVWKDPIASHVNTKKQLSKLDEYKNIYLQLKKEHPNKSRTELQMKAPKVHSYLRKYDNEWLKTKSPPKKKANRISSIVDWEMRDKEMLNCIKEVVKEWDKNEDALTRRTRTAISKKIKKVDVLSKSLNRLPKTKQYLELVTEDSDAFKRRKVQFIRDSYKKSYTPLTEGIVYRKVGRVGMLDETKMFIALNVAEHNAEIL